MTKMTLQLQNIEIEKTDFFSRLDARDKLKNFVSFCARFPDLSLENCVELYEQNADADGLIFREDMLEFFSPTIVVKQPRQSYVLRSPALNEKGELYYTVDLFYCVPHDSVNPVRTTIFTFYYIFKRLGYVVKLSKDTTAVTLDEKNKTVVMPAEYSNEQKADAFIKLLVDMFWTDFRTRETMIHISNEQWRRFYRRAIIYMFNVNLGNHSTTFHKTFYTYLSDDRSIKLLLLQSLFTEFVQVVKGKHFTLEEAMIWYAADADIYRYDISPASFVLGSLPMSYEMMIERYVDTFDEDIPFFSNHPYNEWAKQKLYHPSTGAYVNRPREDTSLIEVTKVATESD